MDLCTVQRNTLERLNRYRRLHSLITSDLFVKLFSLSKDKETAIKHIDAGDIEGVNTWITRQKRTVLEFMSVGDLRLECRLRGIPNYHLLQKEEMLERIKRIDDALREGKDGIDRKDQVVTLGNDRVGSV